MSRWVRAGGEQYNQAPRQPPSAAHQATRDRAAYLAQARQRSKQQRDYFDDDDDDEDELLRETAPTAEDNDEVDPLDAFMAGMAAEEPQRKKTRTELPKGDDDEPIHDMLKHSAFAAFYEFTSRPEFLEVMARHNVRWMQEKQGTKKVDDQWVTRGKSQASEIWRVFEAWWEQGGHVGKNASIDVLLAKLLPAYEAGLTRDKAGSVQHEIAKLCDPDVLAADGGPPALKSATIHAYHNFGPWATALNNALFMWDYRLQALGEKGESEEPPPGDEANDSSEDDESSEDSELSEDDADKDPSYCGRKK